MVAKMHEWSLAESVIETALSIVAKEQVKKVFSVKIKLGELQQIDVDIFELALKELSKGTLLENAKMEILSEEAVLKCRVCGYEWSFKSFLEKLDEEDSESIHFVPELVHVFAKCPKCGSKDFEIIKGRGVYIEGMEVEK